MYSEITDPVTNEKIKTTSSQGKALINNYLYYYNEPLNKCVKVDDKIAAVLELKSGRNNLIPSEKDIIIAFYKRIFNIEKRYIKLEKNERGKEEMKRDYTYNSKKRCEVYNVH